MKSVFTLLTVSVCELAAAGASPPDWIVWEVSTGGNGHLYKAVCGGEPISWEQASAAAVAAGGYLATTTTADENAFVYSLVDRAECFTLINGAGPAIGGLQLKGSKEPAGGWVWITDEGWEYTNWAPGQPNDYPGGPSEERLQFFSGVAGVPSPEWNDLDMDDQNLGGYVIERDPPIPSDLNEDGDVDGFDLALLLGQWTGAVTYTPCPPITPADLNGDCKVNGFDLALLLGAWG